MREGIAYYRISTTGQEDNTSLDEQKRRVKACCEAKNIDLVQEFKDTASGGNCDREGYQKALDYMEENAVDCIVVLKLDRIHRNQQNLLVFESNLREKGIAFISVCEDIDTSSPLGKLIFQILGSFAEFERNLTNERTKGGRIAKLKKEVTPGDKPPTAGGKPPYGYAKNWDSIPDEADNVKRFFKEYLRCKSLGKLQKFAKDEKMQTRHEKDFSRQSLHVILTNRAYLGEYRYDGKKEHHGKIFKKHHDAIITPQLFGRVQHALKKKVKKK